uniref:Uncharacterized protein n=1 Tax=Ditylenchus dipsaci TaxID=166011 RepID=A0A915EIC5_9BILA
MARPKKSKKSGKSHGHRKPIDEGTVELEVSLKELPYVSEQISFGSMMWQIHLKRNMISVDENKEEGTSKEKKDNTQEPAKKKRCCKARGVFTLKKYKDKLLKNEQEISNYNTKFITVFHRCNQYRIFTKFAPFTAVSKNSSAYILHDKITVSLRWKITTVNVDLFPSYDFNKPTPFSDVTLTVEGKSSISNDSTSFCLLSILVARLWKDVALLNFLPLLSSISRECKLSAGMKLKLADRFDLTKLKARILRKLDDQKGLNKARDLQGLSAGTLQTIVRKTELVKSGVYKSDNYGGIDFEKHGHAMNPVSF